MVGCCTSVRLYCAAPVVAGKIPARTGSNLVDLMTSFASVVAVFAAFASPSSAPSVTWQVLHCRLHYPVVHPYLVLHPCYSRWTSMAEEVVQVPGLRASKIETTHLCSCPSSQIEKRNCLFVELPTVLGYLMATCPAEIEDLVGTWDLVGILHRPHVGVWRSAETLAEICFLVAASVDL